MEKIKVAVLGCGNMAEAIVVPAARQNGHLYNFYTYTPSGTRARALAQKINGIQIDEIADIPICDLYIIACKPQQFSDLMKKFILPLNAVALSVMAGISLKDLAAKLNSAQIVRVMPNTPAQIGLGAHLFFNAPNLDEKLLNYTKNFMQFSGKIFQLKTEIELDQLTLVSGCGPAYVYFFAESIKEKLCEEFPLLDPNMVDELVRETFLGASTLMRQSELPLSQLIDKVTSKGGITIEAIRAMQENIPDEIHLGFQHAWKRTLELKRKV